MYFHVHVVSRICPGKELADASVFATIAMSIAIFDVKRAKGEEHRSAESYLEWKKDFIRFVFIIYVYNFHDLYLFQPSSSFRLPN